MGEDDANLVAQRIAMERLFGIAHRLRDFIALGAEQGRTNANWWELRDVLSGETTAPAPSWNPWVELTPERIEAIRAASNYIAHTWADYAEVLRGMLPKDGA